MIEWMLSPSNDNERAISYAMKLYSANKIGDTVVDRYLGADDRKLERSLKQLQARKLASEQGLDWEDYTTDDAAENNRTAQGAIAYGARQATPKSSASVQSMSKTFEFAKQVPRTVLQAARDGAGLESQGFFMKEALRNLKDVAGSATMGNRIKSILRTASFL